MRKQLPSVIFQIFQFISNISISQDFSIKVFFKIYDKNVSTLKKFEVAGFLNFSNRKFFFSGYIMGKQTHLKEFFKFLKM